MNTQNANVVALHYALRLIRLYNHPPQEIVLATNVKKSNNTVNNYSNTISFQPRRLQTNVVSTYPYMQTSFHVLMYY